jgi:hypothetical protein
MPLANLKFPKCTRAKRLTSGLSQVKP